jgi:putative methionine-R-sulfoxide reductase with GAF domain
LAQLAVLNRCYKAGYSPERAESYVNNPELLRDHRFEIFGRMISDVLLCAYEGDREKFYDAISERSRKLLDCESILVFRREDGNHPLPDYVMVAGTTQAMLDRPKEPMRIKGADADRWNRIGLVINLSGDMVREEPKDLRLSRNADTGEAGDVHSLLLVAVESTTNSPPNYWLVASNKLGDLKVANPATFFDASDESVLVSLGSLFRGAHRILEHEAFSAELWELVESQQGMSKIFDSTLHYLMRSFQAHRADAALWDVRDRTLKYVSHEGANNISLGRGTPVPARSVTRWVFEHARPRNVDDREKDEFFFECDANSRSEYAFPISNPNSIHPLGVINLESPVQGGFNQIDFNLIKRKLALLSVHAYSSGSHEEMWNLVTTPGQSALQVVLQDVHRELGFTHGQIFLASHRDARLDLKAALSTSDWREGFSYDFRENALATRVFHTQEPYFAEDPENNLYVSRIGIRTFNIEGPLLGVPLRMGSAVVGVLIVWGFNHQGRGPTPEDKLSLVPFASLSAATLYSQQFEKMARVLVELASPDQPTDPTLYLTSLCQGLIDGGFSRARAFVRCDLPGEKYARYRRVVSIPDLELKEVSAETCSYVRFEDQAGRVSKAEERDPLSAGSHPDPNAVELKKSPDGLWVTAPAWVGREERDVVGYIAADHEPESRRKSTQAEIFLMTLAAPLAASALDQIRAAQLRNRPV